MTPPPAHGDPAALSDDHGHPLPLRRIVQAILTIIGIVLLNFILFRMMPGSPERDPQPELVGRGPTPALRERWGLDKPLIPDQLVDYVAATVQGDFGESYKYKGRAGHRGHRRACLADDHPVSDLGELIAIVGRSSPSAPTAEWRRGGPIDYGGNGLSLILYSMPYFLARHDPAGDLRDRAGLVP